MDHKVVPFRRSLEYDAKLFRVAGFTIAGTLCGNIDLATPGGPTHCLSPDEVRDLIGALQASRQDVLANSRPYSDCRIYEGLDG